MEAVDKGCGVIRSFEESLERIVPKLEDLEIEVNRYPLNKRERNQVLQSMERVYYLIWLMKNIQNFFKEKIQFGGGAILNYIFLKSIEEPPRMTFDLDSHWNEPISKRSLLKEMLRFNKYLKALIDVRMPVDDVHSITIYVVEHDIEKDFFSNVLFLRVPVITRWTGETFHAFVKRITGFEMKYVVLTELRKVFEKTLGVKDAKIDYIRFEVSFGSPLPYTKYSVQLPFNLGTQAFNITELEYQLASKIVNKLCKDYGKTTAFVLHDVLKALLDMRLLKYVNGDKLTYYVKQADKNPAVLLDNFRRNITALMNVGARYWGSHHYILIRKVYTLETLVENTREMLEDVLTR
ncbi:MAG: hypothetical protein DRN15_10985 [Thermoprotei archaeon]|nr:MAG: hypothetical protein DRN15_10985 [Thermoprotei archaeon]